MKVLLVGCGLMGRAIATAIPACLAAECLVTDSRLPRHLLRPEQVFTGPPFARLMQRLQQFGMTWHLDETPLG